MTMIRSHASVIAVFCEPCRDLGLPELGHNAGYLPGFGDRAMRCHDAMNHIDATGHQPVTVIETDTTTYGERQ